ncbi:MAG: hypothetical protein QOD98_3870 [Nocardioidaceae bacterium]|jgi:hypothetical protein|nr:hypothetical protein [Nocardioidaceae bacterium]
MSDDNPTQTGDLGEMPDAEIEPREPNPGGVDAQSEDDDNIPADLDPEDNPAVTESPDPLKEVLAEGEDTDTESTKSSNGSDDDVEPHEDSPA